MTSPSPEAPLVLIVDDSDKNRKLAREVLRAAEFRTLEAARGDEAIAVAAERQPDLILLDLRLPDMDGTEVARKLRGSAETGRIPIVALSASPISGGGQRLMAAGFDGYLQKPIDVREFPHQVHRYCGTRSEAPTRRSAHQNTVPASDANPRQAR